MSEVRKVNGAEVERLDLSSSAWNPRNEALRAKGIKDTRKQPGSGARMPSKRGLQPHREKKYF